MNPAHLHLLLNHVPVIGALFGLLTLMVGLARRSEETKKLALLVIVFAALSAVPAYLSGEPAESIAEGMPGVTEAVIEPHEEAALTAFIVLGLTGALALFELARVYGAKKSSQRIIVMVVLVLSLVSSGLMARTANLGGMIRHTEIRGAIAGIDTIPSADAESEEDD